MKFLPVLLSLGLAGCQASVPVPVLPTPPQVPAEHEPGVAAPVTPVNSAAEQKIRLQAQYIEALVSQNDALSAKLATVAATPVRPVVASSAPEVAAVPLLSPVPVPAHKLLSEPQLTPNADGIIDLAAVLADPKPGEPVNPFAIRTISAESVREVTLHVAGIMGGPVPCALINDQLVQTGESAESFTVERIEPDAVWLRYAGHRLRLPVSEKPTRVRLPI